MRYLLILLFCFSSISLYSQSQQTIAQKTKDFKRYDGYFTFWWDAKDGRIWLQVDKLDQEFLYVNSLPAGLGSNDLGLDRGQIGNYRIVYFNRVGNKLLLIQPNYDFRAVTG